MDAPIPDDELRARVREIADACIVDSMISYIAALREEHLITPEAAEVIIDEWSSAMHESGVMTRETLEDHRAGRVKRVIGELDAFVEQAIEDRRTSMRAMKDDGDDPPDVAEEN